MIINLFVSIIFTLYSNLIPIPNSFAKLGKSISTKISTKISGDLGPSIEEISKRGERLLIKLADYLYDNELSLLKIIHDRMFSKTIDGREYQLIKQETLYQRLEFLNLTSQDRFCIEQIVKPLIRDLIDVESLAFYMKNIGIEEKIPKPTKAMDYSVLKGPSIRIFNKILKYMKRNNFSTVGDLIEGENLTEIYEVVSRDKVHQISVIPVIKFRDFLREIGIVPFGEDLDEDFTDFLAINEDFDNLLMVKKLSKSLKDVAKYEYFSYFGTDKRYEGMMKANRKSSKHFRSLSRPGSDKSLSSSLSLKSIIEETPKVRNIQGVIKGELKNLEEFTLGRLSTK